MQNYYEFNIPVSTFAYFFKILHNFVRFLFYDRGTENVMFKIVFNWQEFVIYTINYLYLTNFTIYADIYYKVSSFLFIYFFFSWLCHKQFVFVVN